MDVVKAERKQSKLSGHQSAITPFILKQTTVVMGLLDGLALTRSERVIIIGLSYAWCTPLLLWFGRQCLNSLRLWETTDDSSQQQQARRG